MSDDATAATATEASALDEGGENEDDLQKLPKEIERMEAAGITKGMGDLEKQSIMGELNNHVENNKRASTLSMEVDLLKKKRRELSLEVDLLEKKKRELSLEVEILEKKKRELSSEVDTPKKKRKEEDRDIGMIDAADIEDEEEEQGDSDAAAAAEYRSSRIKFLDTRLQSVRNIYNKQVENDIMLYQYPHRLWNHWESSFESYNPESLDGVYDIIFVCSEMHRQFTSRTIKDAALTISHDDGYVRGRAMGELLDLEFMFEGRTGNFPDFDVRPPFPNSSYIPKGSLRVLADNFVCSWNLARYVGSVPECDTIEEANEFIRQQQKVMDHSKSWVRNHLNLPAPAVSLIHEFAKAWTPPRPFFFFEKGDLCLQVNWLEGNQINWLEGNQGANFESHYIARKRPTQTNNSS